MINDKMKFIIALEITYTLNKDKENKLKIFDSFFINNNKDKCKILYNGFEYEIKEYFEDFYETKKISDEEELL